MATIANASTIPQNVPIDVGQPREVTLQRLSDNEADIVAQYGQSFYDQWYSNTEIYYDNNNQLNQGIILPTGSIDPALVSTSGFTVSYNPAIGAMQKISNESLGLNDEIEIRPTYSKRVPNENPFMIEMVDTQFKSYAILLENGVVITFMKLAPNPTTLTINSSKIINRYNTMTRWVEEHWGDEIDNITFSGSTFAFLAATSEGIPDTGLTVQYRNDTQSYAMLREMSKLFMYNGMLFQDNKTYEGSGKQLGEFANPVDRFLTDGGNYRFLEKHPREGMAKERLYVRLFFDYVSAIGYFDSFDIVEDSTAPFKMTYSIIFKSEKTTYHQGILSGK